MTDLSREAVDAALLRKQHCDLIAYFAALTKTFLQGAKVPEDELLRVDLAMSLARNAILKSSGGGGVAGVTGSPASFSGEVSPLPVSHKGFEPIYDPLGPRPTNADGSPYRFSDPLAEEEASKASAPKGPADAVVIQFAELRQRAQKLARHDNERKPQP